MHENHKPKKTTAIRESYETLSERAFRYYHCERSKGLLSIKIIFRQNRALNNDRSVQRTKVEFYETKIRYYGY